MKIALRGWLLVSLIVSVSACAEPPPPEVPPVAAPEPPPPPPEPPPPTCEAMADHCKADADTSARIPEVPYAFTPPEGWEYAMLEEATVTQASDDGPVLVLASMVHEKASYKAKPHRQKMVASLCELVGVEPPKRVSFAAPKKRHLSELSMTLWEDAAARGSKKGALLLLSTHVGEREIFGIGFAPEGDIEGTEAILASLETFKATAKPDEDEPEHHEDGKNKK